MTALSYPFALLPLVIVIGVTATIIVPLLAFVWLAILFVVAFVAVVALGWGLVAALGAVGRRLSWHWLRTAPPQRAGSVHLGRTSGRR